MLSYKSKLHWHNNSISSVTYIILVTATILTSLTWCYVMGDELPSNTAMSHLIYGNDHPKILVSNIIKMGFHEEDYA